MKNFFRKPASYLVLALVVLFLWFGISESKAETAFGIAPVVTYSGDRDKDQLGVLLTERFADKYDVGLVLVLDEEENRTNGLRGIEFLRITQKRGWEAGIGYAFWNRESRAWSADSTFSLLIGKQLGDSWAIRWRHWSTAGTSRSNAGLDMLVVSYRF